MDFPLNLIQNAPVLGMDELKQDIELILTEFKGSFLQSCSLGAEFSPHVENEDIIRVGIRKTIEQLRGIKVIDIQMQLPEVTVEVKYMDDVVKFQFNLNIDEG